MGLKPFGAGAIWGWSHLGLMPFGAVAIWGCSQQKFKNTLKNRETRPPEPAVELPIISFRQACPHCPNETSQRGPDPALLVRDVYTVHFFPLVRCTLVHCRRGNVPMSIFNPASRFKGWYIVHGNVPTQLGQCTKSSSSSQRP